MILTLHHCYNMHMNVTLHLPSSEWRVLTQHCSNCSRWCPTGVKTIQWMGSPGTSMDWCVWRLLWVSIRRWLGYPALTRGLLNLTVSLQNGYSPSELLMCCMFCISPDWTRMYAERPQMPAVDQTLAQLAGAIVFLKLDANSGFWQIPLSPEFGRFHFTDCHLG